MSNLVAGETRWGRISTAIRDQKNESLCGYPADYDA